MSTILKALRRLEEDKRAQATRSLEHAVLEPAKPQRRLGLGLGVAAGVAATLGVIALAWALRPFWLPASEQDEPTSAALVAQRAVAATPPARVAIEDAPRPPATRPVPLPATSAESRIAAARAAAATQSEGSAPTAAATAASARREVERVRSKPSEVEVAKRVAKQSAPPHPAPRSKADPVQKTVQEVAPKSATDSETKPSIDSETGPKGAQLAVVREPASEQDLDVKPDPAPKTAAAPPRAVSPPPVAARPPARTPIQAPVQARSQQPPTSNLSRAAAMEEPVVVQVAVEQIIWHPRSERRVAVVRVAGEPAARRLAEGELVAGYTVAKIGVSDVELLRDGVSTKRRVGAN